MPSLPIHIELTEFEQALLDQIDFDPAPASDVIARASGKASRQLMESLEKRRAIPTVRRACFTDAYPGLRGKSHMEVLRSKLAGSNRHVFEDPDFVRGFLRYFIFGPDLPRGTVEKFCEIAAGGDLGRLRSFVRQESRQAGLEKRRRTADEFYKLALECVPGDPFTSRRIRTAAMQAR